jgi:hypothetical protein
MNPNSLFADHQNKLRASNASVRLTLLRVAYCRSPMGFKVHWKHTCLHLVHHAAGIRPCACFLQARLLSVDSDIRPVIEYLTSLGLSEQQVKEVSYLCALCQHNAGRVAEHTQNATASCMLRLP